MKTREIAEFLGAELVGDGDVEIHSVWEVGTASSGQLAFIDAPKIPKSIGASCVILGDDKDINLSVPVIKVKDPKLAFARIADALHTPHDEPVEIHSSTVIADTAIIGESVSIGAHCSVGDETMIGPGTRIRPGVRVGRDVSIGKGCHIHANVSIENGVSIGNNVTIYSGSVIGGDGFGYVKDENGDYQKFPQIGSTVIEDNVEIGANSCVDRGALGETRIGEGTKIDNLVQIAHNVQIGKRVIIAAQTGISGSTVLEDDCVIGGQVGMGDHARVQSGAVIGSQAGVLPGKIVRPGVWWGTPVQPLGEYKRQNAMIKGLARLREDVKELKKRLLK